MSVEGINSLTPSGCLFPSGLWPSGNKHPSGVKTVYPFHRHIIIDIYLAFYIRLYSVPDPFHIIQSEILAPTASLHYSIPYTEIPWLPQCLCAMIFHTIHSEILAPTASLHHSIYTWGFDNLKMLIHKRAPPTSALKLLENERYYFVPLLNNPEYLLKLDMYKIIKMLIRC